MVDRPPKSLSYGKPGDPPPIMLGGGGYLTIPLTAFGFALIIVGLVLAFSK